MPVVIPRAPVVGWYFPVAPTQSPYYWTGKAKFKGNRAVGVCVILNFHPEGGSTKPFVQPTVQMLAPDQVRGLGDDARYAWKEEPPTTWKGQDITDAVFEAVQMGNSYRV